MQFQLLDSRTRPPSAGQDTVYLKVDHWNDYSFVTMFNVSLHDENGTFHTLGSIKIGFKGQDVTASTYSTLQAPFTELPDNYFSLGTDVDYYAILKRNLSDGFAHHLLTSLKDIAFDAGNLKAASEEQVFRTSLLRGVSMSVIKGQFKRVLGGDAPLTDFSFAYQRPQEERFAGIDLNFEVKTETKPSSNIHAIIGRNGVGKTTLLNGMIEAITNNDVAKGTFLSMEGWQASPIESDYFSSLVSVSFSAFDPFDPPPDQPNPALGTCYYYIGLKDCSDDEVTKLKTLPQLHSEFASNLAQCFSEDAKKERWLTSISALESDVNFAAMRLEGLAEFSGNELKTEAIALIKRMSSGHAIVLLTLTKLVATVEEKTLVLVDEPESHLHPPLLSAFTRALSQLLYRRNGVAIIATHSPVVLQEIPKSCVWKITRSRLAVSKSRPEIETFGENVGVLTREIFGLEVVKSGFHTLLDASVKNNATYDQVIEEYGGQLGYEARAILRSMILERDHGGQEQ